MTHWRRSALTLATLVALLLGAWIVVESQLRGSVLLAGVHPDLLRQLERSLEDQKELARLAPERQAELRSRFRQTEELLRSARILALHHEALIRRLRWFVFALVALAGGLVAGWSALRQRREAAQLARLGEQIDALARGVAGPPPWRATERHVFARIGRLVTAAADRLRSAQQRNRFLQHLAIWQNGARHLSHELKTPLMAIRLGVDRLRGGSSGEQDEILQRIDGELGRLERDLGAFASITRLPPPEVAELELGAVAARFVDTFGAAWPHLALQLVSAADPLPVCADPGQLRQVLTNLCDNAERAAQRCDRKLDVTLAVSRHGSEAWIEVTDDGPGLDPAVRPRLFEPFVTASRAQGGSGLGLTISRSIALEHGGDLEWVEPPPGDSGCTFRLLLPLREGP